MNLSTIILGAAILGGCLGVIRPWLGAIAGLITFLIALFICGSNDIANLIIIAVAGTILGAIAGFISSIVFSGLKGKGHNTGPIFISGFGGGRGGAPPSGIILSDEERQKNKR